MNFFRGQNKKLQWIKFPWFLLFPPRLLFILSMPLVKRLAVSAVPEAFMFLRAFGVMFTFSAIMFLRMTNTATWKNFHLDFHATISFSRGFATQHIHNSAIFFILRWVKGFVPMTLGIQEKKWKDEICRLLKLPSKKSELLFPVKHLTRCRNELTATKQV